MPEGGLRCSLLKFSCGNPSILADSGRFWQILEDSGSTGLLGQSKAQDGNLTTAAGISLSPFPFASLVSYKFSVKSFVPHLLESCMGRRISLTLFVNVEFPVPGIFTVGSTMKSSFSRI